MQKQKLGTLIEQMLKLIGYVERLDSTVIEEEEQTELINDIKDCVRKLVMVNMLEQQYVIAITGLQGAGKSSLVQSLYDLPDEVISIEIGRGETAPILIKENADLKEKTYHCWKHTVSGNLNGESTDNKLPVLQEEFAKLAKHSDIDIMYLELEVPVRYFVKKEPISFLLLPGFEQMKSTYWQEFVQFALSCSDTCISVCKAETLANSGSTALAGKLKKALPQNALPIFAVSFSEDILMKPTDEESKQYKDDIWVSTKEMFSLQDGEKDRVVFTGRCTDEAKNTMWKETLVAACQKYAAPMEKALLEQSSALKGILEDNIDYIYCKAKEVADVAEETSAMAQNNLYSKTNGMLDAFNREAEAGRKAFCASLNKALKAQQDISYKNLEAFYLKNPSLKTIAGDIGSAVFREGTKAQIKNEHRFEQFVTEEIDGVTSYHGGTACLNALQEHGNYKLKQFSSVLQLKENNPLAAVMQTSDNSIQEQNHLVIKNAIADVQSIMQNANDAITELTELKSTRQDTVAKALYVLSSAAYTMQAMQHLKGEVCAVPEEEFTPADLIATIDAMQAEKEKFVDDTKYGLGAVMESAQQAQENYNENIKTGLGAGVATAAVDLAQDGAINFLSQASAALGVSVPVVATAAVVAAIAVGGVTSTRYINAMGKHRMTFDKISVHRYYATVQQGALESYDAYLDTMREKICDYYLKLNQGAGESMDAINLKILLAHLRDQMRTVEEGLNADNLHRILQETV